MVNKQNKSLTVKSQKLLMVFTDLTVIVVIFFILLLTISQTDSIRQFQLKEQVKTIGVGGDSINMNEEFKSIHISEKKLTLKEIHQYKETLSKQK